MASMASYAQNYKNTVTFGSSGIENVISSSLYQENQLITGGLYQGGFELNGEMLPFHGGNADAFFVRYTDDGEIDMVKTFGGWADDAVTAVTEDAEGNIYITGYFQGSAQGGTPFDADPSESGVYNLEQPGALLTRDLFLVKLDSKGEFLWAKQISNTQYGANEDANAIAVDNKGGLYLAGSFAQADFNTGGSDTLPNIVMTKSGKHEGFLVKLEAETGNFEWLEHFYGGQCSFSSLAIDSENESIIAAGDFKKKFSPGVDSITYNSEGILYNSFLTRITFDGEVEWVRHWGGTGNVVTDNVWLLSNGDIVTGGWFTKSSNLNPDDTSDVVEPKGQADVWWSKFDAQGNFIFNNSFGGKGFDDLASIQEDINGNLLLVATFSDTASFASGQNSNEFIAKGDADIILMSLASNGDFLSHITIEGADAYASLDAFVNANGDIMMSGAFAGAADFNPYEGEDIHSSNGFYDGFFSRFVWDAVTGISEYNAQAFNFSVYPNPVQSQINIKGEQVESFQLYDMQGNLVKQGEVNGQSILVDDLKKGAYVLSLTNTAGLNASQAIIKK